MGLSTFLLLPLILVTGFVIRWIGYYVATYAYSLSLDQNLIKSSGKMAAIEMGVLAAMIPVVFVTGLLGYLISLFLLSYVMVTAGMKIYTVGVFNAAIIFLISFIVSGILGYPAAEYFRGLS